MKCSGQVFDGEETVELFLTAKNSSHDTFSEPSTNTKSTPASTSPDANSNSASSKDNPPRISAENAAAS